jgi:predicted alpha/beta hydrolase family esterase
MRDSVYYLPGANGRLDTGLGEGLAKRGLQVWGRATVGEFKNLSFQEQVDLIATDLQSTLSRADALVVANSYGAYLFLHAQLQIPAYVGRVLLLSPILGKFENEKTFQHFIPPRADHLKRAIRNGTFRAPINIEIHVGSEDWQSVPEEVESFGKSINARVHVAGGRGHMLGEDYVGPILDRWLTE